jgi:hypothetical protein
VSARRAARLAPLLAALIVSACGGSGSAPQGPEPTKNAPAPASGLRVGATDLRLGDATEADATGLRELRVQRRVDAEALRGRGQRRDGVGAGASCPDVDVLPDGTNTAVVVASTLCLLNGERADAGLAPLTHEDRLAAAALAHSRDMVDNQYFAHLGQDGRDVVDRIRATGYLPERLRWTVGENLAWGTGTLSTPRNIVAAWMNSQGHRENILRGAFREIGFGVVTGNPRSSDGTGATYTTTFGFVESGAQESAPSAPQTAALTAPASTSESGARKSAERKKARKSRARKRARKARRAARRAHARAMRAAATRA